MRPCQLPSNCLSLLLIRFSGALTLASLIAACESTLPVIESPPPPPPRVMGEGPGPLASPPAGRTIGTLPQMPVPRFAVSLFAFPQTGSATEAAYSPEWSSRVVTRLDLNHVTAHALSRSATLPAGDLEQATAALLEQPGAGVADVLLAGTILPGNNTQVRLFARDTRDGRLIARSEFEGKADATLSIATDDAFAQVNRYWFDLARGQFSHLRVEVKGLRTDPEIGLLQDSLVILPGVRAVRHEETRVEREEAQAAFRLTHEGVPDGVLDGIARLTWVAGGKTARLERVEGLTFRARYVD